MCMQFLLADNMNLIIAHNRGH